MRNYLYMLFACILTLSFTACDDDDQYDIESVIVGRSWTGDVGMNDEFGEPLFSTFTFGADGFGDEFQYYISDGHLYDSFRFMWYWEDRYSNNLVLDYNGTVSYMDDVRVIGNELRGTFYFTHDSPGYIFNLEME